MRTRTALLLFLFVSPLVNAGQIILPDPKFTKNSEYTAHRFAWLVEQIEFGATHEALVRFLLSPSGRGLKLTYVMGGDERAAFSGHDGSVRFGDTMSEYLKNLRYPDGYGGYYTAENIRPPHYFWEEVAHQYQTHVMKWPNSMYAVDGSGEKWSRHYNRILKTGEGLSEWRWNALKGDKWLAEDYRYFRELHAKYMSHGNMDDAIADLHVNYGGCEASSGICRLQEGLGDFELAGARLVNKLHIRNRVLRQADLLAQMESRPLAGLARRTNKFLFRTTGHRLYKNKLTGLRVR